MVLAQKLKQLRAERGWAQAELAKRSGVDRRTISYLENKGSNGRPSAEVLLRLSRAFRIKPEELYQAAGYIKEAALFASRTETPEEILDRLRIATPQSIPVYPWETYPVNAGANIEPIDYIYRARTEMASNNIEAYVVHGKCMEPEINEGDVIIVERGGVIDNGDIVACIMDGEFHILKVHKVAGEVWLENKRRKARFEDVKAAAPVIECVRKLK